MVDKIINYISETPENTNPAILTTLLGDLNKQSDTKIDSADVVRIVKDEFVAALRKKKQTINWE